MFISVVPSVWHVFSAISVVMLFFLTCFIRLDFHRQLEWPPCRTEDLFVIVQIGLTVCPPLYLMFILWVLGVKIRYVLCLFVVMSAVAGRTHVNWRYRTLRLGVIRQG